MLLQLDKVEDSIAFINSKPKPLAIYAFTNNEKFRRRMLSETSSGSLVFNDAVIQVLRFIQYQTNLLVSFFFLKFLDCMTERKLSQFSLK